ncbi:DUF1616 domain-containing protein [Haloarcula sp. AONF1]
MADRLVDRPGFLGSDLILIAILGLSITVQGALGIETVSSVLLGVSAILFAPGYAIIALLFPKSASSGSRTWANGEITIVERMVLGIGVSIFLVPLLGIGLGYTPLGMQPTFFVTLVGSVTLLFTVLAAVRRQTIPPSERFDPRVLHWTASQLKGVRDGSVVTVLLVVGLVIATAGIGVTAATTDPGEEFTAFSVTTADPTDSTSVAGDYPDEILLEEDTQLQVGITNREGEQTSYTVVVLLESFDGKERQSSSELDRYSVTIVDGGSVQRAHTVIPDRVGEDLRLTYLLYKREVSADTGLNADSAYRSVHIWVDVPSESA